MTPQNTADSLQARDSAPAGGRLTIDLGGLAANWKAIAAGVASETGAVVKGDGYGIGLIQAGRALAAAGCRTFFVALPEEGLTLRATLPSAVIYVLDGLVPGSLEILIAANLRPVLGSLAEIEEWARARQNGAATSAALHVDTGMNRLGLTVAEAEALAADASLMAALSPSLIMSHLAAADTPAHALNARQLKSFRAVRDRFAGVPASLANSAGIALGPDYHFDLVRPGIALYGAVFAQGTPPLAPVATLEATVLTVREAKRGETVGYGATQTLKRAARIAILGIGYADGYHRAAGSADGRPGARAFVRGKPAPLVGRVSMDLIAIDVSDIAGVARGDTAELFGPNIPVDEAAGHAGTIGYEFLTSLGRRTLRRYVG